MVRWTAHRCRKGVHQAVQSSVPTSSLHTALPLPLRPVALAAARMAPSSPGEQRAQGSERKRESDWEDSSQGTSLIKSFRC